MVIGAAKLSVLMFFEVVRHMYAFFEGHMYFHIACTYSIRATQCAASRFGINIVNHVYDDNDAGEEERFGVS